MIVGLGSRNINTNTREINTLDRGANFTLIGYRLISALQIRSISLLRQI